MFGKKKVNPIKGTWSYRLVRKPTGFAIHVIHYDPDGTAIRMDPEPVDFTATLSEGQNGLETKLKMVLNNIQQLSVFDPPADWLSEPKKQEEKKEEKKDSLSGLVPTKVIMEKKPENNA